MDPSCPNGGGVGTSLRWEGLLHKQVLSIAGRDHGNRDHSPPPRVWNGVGFPSPAPGCSIPSHTTIEFSAKHLMVAKVKGRFAEFEGALSIADDPTASSTVITVKAAASTRAPRQRDDHLRSPDFLDAAAYPELTFTSTGFEHAGGERWKLRGDLTIRGVTRPVTLVTEYNGQTADLWGGERAFFSAETTIDREDWGLTWNQALETGGWLVGKEIRIAIEIEAVLQS